MRLFSGLVQILAASAVLSMPFAAAGAEAPEAGPSGPSLEIVECQLPANVRKFGPGSVRLVPGEIVRISAEECRARKGEPRESRRTAAR